jgi:hypothetical protein
MIESPTCPGNRVKLLTSSNSELRSQPQFQSQPWSRGQDHQPHRSQAQRHDDTAAVATRRTAPRSPAEDEELAGIASVGDLEVSVLQ